MEIRNAVVTWKQMGESGERELDIRGGGSGQNYWGEGRRRARISHRLPF